MANKKIPISFTPTEEALEKKVEAMMEAPRKSAPEVSTSVQEPIDIFNDPKTAPQVPAGLKDKLKIDVTSHDNDEVEPIAAAEQTKINVTSAPELPKVEEKVEEPATEVEDESVADEIPVELPAPDEADELAEETEAEPELPFVPPAVITLEPPNVVPQLVKNPSTAIVPHRIVEPMSGPVVNDIGVPPLKIDDKKTDAAVDDITSKEGDELLAAQDELRNLSGRAVTAKTKKPRRRFKKRWIFLIFLLLAIAGAAAYPASRYKAAGLVVKKDLEVQVLDSKSLTPVSKAEVLVNGQTVQTDANGKAKIKVGVGNHQVAINKQYYASTSTARFVDFKDGQQLAVKLVATGRQVPITIIDMLTDKPISGAEIKILNTSAKTDSKGRALIVLPTKTATVDGKISSGKFNTQSVKVAVTDKDVPENNFKLSPTGKVYFLSNEAGTIDVVKANLDGTERKTILKGTGKEEPNTTVLIASRDWRYMVLKAQRTGSQAAMYLIDSSSDKLTEFDSGNANFTPIGWSGDSFIYDAVRNTVATSQTGHEQIKAYDASRGQLNLLDQTQAEGDGNNFIYQSFYNFNIIGDQLIYNLQWYSSGTAELAKKSNAIRGVLATGQNKKDHQTIPASGTGYIQAALAKPQEVVFASYNFQDSKTSFYEFKNGAAKSSTTVNQSSFNKLYPIYITSPSGQQSAWSELRDGKQVVLLADAMGNNPKALPNLAGYTVYGWYSSDYLLVSKNNSELYIVSSSGNKTPAKLTDYYQPTQNQGSYGNL